MTDREDIIRMARDAGLIGGPVYTQGIEKFAAFVAAAEREACAKVAEQVGQHKNQHGIATAIRARGEK